MSARAEVTEHAIAAEDMDSLAVGMDFAAQRGVKRGLVEELRDRHERGDPVNPEEFLSRWPADPRTDSDVASLLFEDYRQRRHRDTSISITEYEERFPDQKDSLAALVRQEAVWRSFAGTHGSSTTTLRLPSVGDELFGFRLYKELGRGAFARVFLAEQSNLAGRPVVLKVSAADGNEPQTLAQLQHTHIVPIYSVHEDPSAGLRAVCMPYFGGASLSAVLRAVFAETAVPLRGQQFVQALSVVRAPWATASAKSGRGDSPSDDRGALALLSRFDYLHAVVWIVARLAEALQHAHQRGILHRDIKPSNILMSADGEPMLLDFNLAQNLADDQSQAHATLGGTVAYMAPEHLLAIARREPALVQQVREPADIYSLGMVLYEMLTGHSPFDQSASYHVLPSLLESMAEERRKRVPSLRSDTRLGRSPGRSDVPWSLESIIRKCLAPDYHERYQAAEHLAEDLRRFLDDWPLKYAPELSRVERARKWLRRHPRITSSGTIGAAAVLLLIASGGALVGVHHHLETTREALEISQAQDKKREYVAGTERAFCLVNTTGDLADHLSEGLRVCEQTLRIYGVLDRTDWQDDPAWQRLDESSARSLREDTRELLLLLAWARVQKAGRTEASLHDALAFLNRAEAIEGLPPSPALWLDRAMYLEQLGDQQAADAVRAHAEHTPPVTARDRYLLATTHARNGRYAEAIAELNESIRLDGRHYWSWFQRGACYLELGKLKPAASDFGVCVGLWPEFAWGHFNLGYVLYRGGEREQAIEHYSAALQCDGSFAKAVFNRGLAYKELGRFREALADFDRTAALATMTDPMLAERALVLEKLGRHDEADQCFTGLFERVDSLEAASRNGIRLAYGFAVAERRGEKAHDAFEAVLRDKGATPQALAQAHYGEGMLLAPTRPRQAIQALSQAIEADANLSEARRFRGILWARVGDFEAAGRDINWCLEHDSDSGSNMYAAACITALAAKKLSGNRKTELASSAIELLKKAFAQGYGKDIAAKDPDLTALRGQPEFERLLRPAK